MQSNKMQKGQKESLRDKIGNAVEKLGDKVSQSGAERVGKKIHDIGDKIEKRHNNPNRSKS